MGATSKFEVWMHARLFCGGSACRIVDKHCIKQIETIIVKTADKGTRRIAVPFGERWFEIRKRCHARPLLLIWGSKKSGSKCQSLLTRSHTCQTKTYRKILKISSISESPGKRGFLVHISANMQPTDHMSTPVEYCRPPRRISGARYQSVTTFKTCVSFGLLLSWNIIHLMCVGAKRNTKSSGQTEIGKL